ncbi:MAG: EamA family transporter [Leptolyngbyaceae cyanobacterium SL_7_1]|nr:EamA family transporter [Leptolyngbyaceae cyanobacterium SL_7_1]
MQATSSTGQLPEVLHSSSSALVLLLNRGAGQIRSLTGSIPPSGLVLLSCLSAQVGTAIATFMFSSIGSMGTVFVCKAIATLWLLAIWRPRWRNHSRQDYLLVGLFGLAMAGMSLAFFGAVSRVPLGVASTLEFLGPLGVALLGSRRPLDLVWVGLAAGGVCLLSPLNGNTSLDPLGVALALLSGVCWAGYILLSVPAGRAFPGGAGLALSMTVATLILLPPGVLQAGTALLDSKVLLLGVGAAFLGTIVTYSLEFKALKTVPPRVFGILMSIEPAIAALVGLLILGEQLQLQSLMAIGLVVMAAIGVTLFGRTPSVH